MGPARRGRSSPFEAPRRLFVIAGFFVYGALMTAIMVVVVSGAAADAIAGPGWNPHRGFTDAANPSGAGSLTRVGRG